MKIDIHNLNKNCIFFIVSIFFIFSLTLNVKSEENSKLIKIGALSKRSHDICFEKWQKTAEYLTKEIPEYNFELIPLNFEEMFSAVENSAVDYVITNPVIYIELEYFYGYNRIATLANLNSGKGFTEYGSVIFSRRDRKDLRLLQDIKGASFMGVNENSFGGWLMAWREFKQNNINPYNDFSSITFADSHDSVIFAVRDGKVDVGTVRTGALEAMASEGKINLRDFYVFEHKETGTCCYKHKIGFPLIHSTKSYPEWLFAESGHITNDISKKIAIALMKMTSDEQAAISGKYIGWTIPLNYQIVHDCLKELEAGPYKDINKTSFANSIAQYWYVPLSLILIILVITLVSIKLKKLNDLLGENERYVQLVLNLVMTGIIILDEKTYEIINMNHYAAELIGTTEEESKGTICNNFIYHAQSENSPIDDGLECKLLRVDGSQIQIIRTSVLATLKKRKCLIVNFFDATPLKNAESALKQSETKFRTLYDSTSDAVMISDDKTFLDCNQATLDMFGYDSVKEFCQNHPSDVSPEFQPDGRDSKSSANEKIKKALADGSNFFDWTHKHKNGKEFSTEVLLNAFMLNNKKVVQAVVRDISERKANEEEKEILIRQLHQSDKMASIGQLAAGVAHEINNPVGFINSNLNTMQKYLWKIAKLLKNAKFENEDIKEKFDFIMEDFGDAIAESLDGTKRVIEIVTNLKGFSRADSNKPELVDLNNGIENTLNIIWNKLKYHCKVEKDFGDLPELNCFPGQINQVFMNLLVNAGHATKGKQGLINIKTWVDDEQIFVSI
ncbi:MAG: hypothetical protein DRP35_09590, partial [Candidatus Zixiibacteriota bacterium]